MLPLISSCIYPGVVWVSHMVVVFSAHRNFHTYFNSRWNNLHQECVGIPFSFHTRQHTLIFIYLIEAILSGMRWILNVVLICISLMTKDVELACPFHLKSVCLLHFPIYQLDYLWINFLTSLYIMDVNLLSNEWQAVFFLPFCRLPLLSANCFLS
jgi:hypothetical protein